MATQNMAANEFIPGGQLVVQQHKNDVEAAQQRSGERDVIRHRVLTVVRALHVFGVHCSEDRCPAGLVMKVVMKYGIAQMHAG